MDFSPGAFYLDAVAGGTLIAGVIPHPRFIRGDADNENDGIIDCTPGDTLLCQVPFVDGVIGDLVLVHTIGQMLNTDPGVTHAGWLVEHGRGTGAISFCRNRFGTCEATFEIPIAGHIHWNGFALAEVITTGTIGIDLSARVRLGRGDVADQTGECRILVIRGS